MPWHSIQFTYLQEPEGEFSRIYCSDTYQSPPAKSKNTQGKCFYKGSLTEFYQCFPFGTILEPCDPTTQNAPKHSQHGKEYHRNSPFVAGSRSLAKISVQLGQTAKKTEHKKASKENAADFGQKCAESLKKSNLSIALLKTPRNCGLADLALCCETLPRWGIMQDGECLEFASLARITSEKGFLSLLPTPTCHNAKEGAYPAEYTRNTPTLAAQIGGKVNPEWNEWRMGWPIGWTDLKPLETDKFQQWLHSHGKL